LGKRGSTPAQLAARRLNAAKLRAEQSRRSAAALLNSLGPNEGYLTPSSSPTLFWLAGQLCQPSPAPAPACVREAAISIDRLAA
jgi:hypothetical protein